MENILIAEKVLDDSITVFPTIADAIAALVPGEMLAIGDGNVRLASTTNTAALVGIKEIVFVVGLKGGGRKTSVSIPRRAIKSYTHQVATTGQSKVITIGGITAPLALVIPSTGEANILLKNLSYNHGIATQRVSYSTMKRSTETPEQFVDRVVLEINEAMALQTSSFATAAKVMSGAFLGIAFTADNASVDLFVGRDGIFADSAYNVTQEAKVFIGAGVDIMAMEKDMQRHHGDAGYQQNGDLWYKEPIQAVADGTYEVSTIYWDGVADTPTSTMVVANNVLQFAANVNGDLYDGSVRALVALIVDGQDKAVVESLDVDDTDNA